MSKKFGEKNIVANEKNEKFFLSIGELLWYNRYNPMKQKAFVPYSEAGESLASYNNAELPWKRRVARQKIFCRD